MIPQFMTDFENKIRAVKFATTRLPRPLHNVNMSIDDAEEYILQYKAMHELLHEFVYGVKYDEEQFHFEAKNLLEKISTAK